MKSINGLRNLSKRGSRNFIDCDYEQKLSASEKEWLVNFNRANYCGDEKAMKEVGFSEELKKQIRHELNKEKKKQAQLLTLKIYQMILLSRWRVMFFMKKNQNKKEHMKDS